MASRTNSLKIKYILEVAWGCPTDKYPLNGLFQFDQAKALKGVGESVVYLALDLRSFRKWRRWGLSEYAREGIQVFEYSFPYGPFSPYVKYALQDFGFLKAIKKIEKKYGKPSVVHVHCCQQAISVMNYCLENKIPYVVTEHITPVNEGAAIEERKKEALNRARSVIAVSHALGRDIMRFYGAESVTIPNVTDLSEFKYKGYDRADTDFFTFVSAASMNYGKGFDVLIKAFSELLCMRQDVGLVIMGDGPETDKIKGMAKTLGIADKISFTGRYVRRDFAKKLCETDFFVLPSRSETFGIVYVEALAMGIPVIATKCGGPEDFVNAANGILVPVDDASALANAMNTMINTRNLYDRDKISSDCINSFSPDAVGEKVRRVLYRWE